MSKQIVIQSAPYRDDIKAWDGLRFAGAALVQGMEVRVRGHGVRGTMRRCSST